MNAKLESALAHARAGWPVFPVHSMRRGRCSCGKAACKSPGKHPRTDNGLKDATRDEAQIRAWWKQWPDANPAGRCDGVVAVDVDVRDGKRGLETLAALEREHAPLRTDLEARTGSGGSHKIFAAREGVRYPGKLGADIDIKAGPGAYILLAGSDHESGGAYTWEIGNGTDADTVEALPVAPRWIESGAQSEKAGGTPDALDEVMRKRDRLPVRDIKDILDALPDEYCNDYEGGWLDVGMALHHHFAGDEEGRHLWHWFSKGSRKYEQGGAAAIDAKWKSFKRDKGGVTIGTLIHAAGGWEKITPRELPSNPLDEDAGGISPKGSALRFYEPKEFDTSKPKLDIVRGLLFANSVGLLYGPSNCGKTFAALYLLVAVAGGLGAFERPTEKRVCLYVGLEGESSIKTRIWAAMSAAKVETQPLHYALGALDILDDRQLDALVVRAVKIKAGFIVIDTLSQAVTGVDTSEMAAMSRVIAALHRIKRATGACVLGVAHRSKKTPNAKGPIGSYVQQMNADTLLEIAVEGDPDIPLHTHRRFLTATKQRDGANGAKFVFGLKQVETPYRDARGQPIETLAVKDGLEQFDNLESDMSEREQAALDALKRLHDIADLCGEAVVTIEAWRRAFYRAHAIAPLSADAKKKAFRRAREELAGQIKVTGDNVAVAP